MKEEAIDQLRLLAACQKRISQYHPNIAPVLHHDGVTLTPSGFWSYAHVDDEATDGHIRRLADQVSNAFRILTGAPLDLFFDRHSIQWGDEWQQKIDNSIHGTTFFIPIITPSYLSSQACRDEFIFFWSKSTFSKLDELLLPILYAPIDINVDSDDEVVSIVSRIQFENWTEVRLESEGSSTYKKAIHKLAARFKDIADLVDKKPEFTVDVNATKPASDKAGMGDRADEPGLLEVIVDIEETMPQWSQAIESMTSALSEIEEAMAASKPDLDKANQSAKIASRITAIKKAAERLDHPTHKFYESAKTYQGLAISMDPGFNALIQLAQMSAEEERHFAVGLSNQIQGMRDTMQQALDNTGELSTVLRDAGNVSRDMRTPTKRISDGMRMLEDTQTVLDNWISGLKAAAPEE
ncbi:toll/interleukin-1 receptor domain-containing protein [Nocardia sp. NPDC051463]|uniref:toll/interleukin-1 receptor domain-containing protein n=1 Tax=Nocardia sp. NPDC051463 TaxID=3154845 RepID=UPI003446A799